MGRAGRLDAKIHLIFDSTPDKPLDLLDVFQFYRAVDRADKEPDVTYVLTGPDAPKAAEIVEELLAGPPPEMYEADAGLAVALGVAKEKQREEQRKATDWREVYKRLYGRYP